jgi:ribonuclease BN (tRNA processing enzyme)
MPAPGAAFVRYGGHTSCVAVARPGERPALVLDAGTGLVNLDVILGDAAFQGTLLLGHLHWDHTQGMPFFSAGARPGHRVDVLLPEQGQDAELVLARSMSPPHFPIEPHVLGAQWRFGSLEEGTHEIEGFSVLAREIPHKGGRTFGYRVSDGSHAIAYVCDHHPLGLGAGPDGLGELHPAAIALAEDVDLLIHDSQCTREELPALEYLGHSCPDYAISLAERAGARQVCLFHHAPRRTDDALDEIAGRYAGCAIPVFAARDGLNLRLASADKS